MYVLFHVCGLPWTAEQRQPAGRSHKHQALHASRGRQHSRWWQAYSPVATLSAQPRHLPTEPRPLLPAPARLRPVSPALPGRCRRPSARPAGASVRPCCPLQESCQQAAASLQHSLARSKEWMGCHEQAQQELHFSEDDKVLLKRKGCFYGTKHAYLRLRLTGAGISFSSGRTRTQPMQRKMKSRAVVAVPIPSACNWGSKQMEGDEG